MDSLLLLTVLIIAVVLLFDYTNGFHDAANLVATVIASRAMTPVQAILLVGTFEFIGPLTLGTAVANTIGKFIDLGGIPALPALIILLSGLLGAIVWNLITWWRGLPSSSSHALIGGLIGATLLAVGSEHIVWGLDAWRSEGHISGVIKVLIGLFLSPLLGFAIGYLIHSLAGLVLRSARPSINTRLRQGQIITTAALAFSHGANDAQKSMGILTLVLLLGGLIPSFEVPFWVMLACTAALTLGILSGGWRIVRTLGFAVYKVRPMHALDSQLTSASVILGASVVGAPVSTSHVVASSIMGIGASEHPRQVRWGKALEMFNTWLITMPAAAVVAAVILLLLAPLSHP